jgi:hypothetical protein
VSPFISSHAPQASSSDGVFVVVSRKLNILFLSDEKILYICSLYLVFWIRDEHMRNQVCELSDAGLSWSCCFQLEAGPAYPWAGSLSGFDLRESDLSLWRLPNTTRISRAVRSGSVKTISPERVSDPVSLLLLIGSHAMLARSLLYPLREPGFWVRRTEDGGWSHRHLPALPETQLAELLEIPTRQVAPALAPLLTDRAVELVRSPQGVRAILLRNDIVDESRFQSRLRA